MGDYAIRMQIEVDAAPEQVTEAITTREGVASWWSTGVSGEPGTAGGRFEVSFPDVPQPFELDVDRDEGEMAWRVGGFPPWWADTTIRWTVQPGADGEGTLLGFRHDGFDQESDIVPIITPAWADILARLRRYAEAGASDPFAVV